MIASKTAMFNQILLRLAAGRVNDWESTEEKAVIIRSFFDQSVDTVLREYHWICATGRAVLAQVSEANLTPYEYAYGLPIDCLAVQTLLEVDSYTDVSDKFLVEGRVLYCNMANAGIKYTKKITDVKQFDSHVAEAIILSIAAKIAFTITKDLGTESNFIMQAEEALRKAKYTDGLERVNSTQEWESWAE